MTDDAFVRGELDKIALYYQLKHTTRWAHDRDGDETESVAEHVYGMHILIDYFLPLIDEAGTMDRTLITQLATWHDMAEAVVSDMTTLTKTEEHKQAEKDAEVDLVTTATPHIQPSLQRIFDLYEAQETPEARFVKAIDKIEPIVHIYFLDWRKTDVKAKFDFGWSADVYREHRSHYLQHFALLKRIDDVLYASTKHLHKAA